MKIVKVEPLEGELVETDCGEFMRHSADNWLEARGESWEGAYTLAPELEQAYQAFRSGNPAKCIVKGCHNHQGEGVFEGVLCGPCHHMLTTGQVGYGETFIQKIYGCFSSLATGLHDLSSRAVTYLEDQK